MQIFKLVCLGFGQGPNLPVGCIASQSQVLHILGQLLHIGDVAMMVPFTLDDFVHHASYWDYRIFHSLSFNFIAENVESLPSTCCHLDAFCMWSDKHRQRQ